MYYSPEEIENAFKILEIPLIPDKYKIILAWKKKALKYHPDKTIQNELKIEYHNKFIELLKARDICLEVADQCLKDSYNNNYKDYQEGNEKPKEDNNEEAEWEAFIRDSKEYFSKIEFIWNALTSFFKIFFHSISLSLLTVVCGLLIGFIFLGILSKAPDFPLFLWILIPISLIFLLFNLYRYLHFLDLFTLKLLIKIGYPLKFFIFIWIIENFLFFLLLYIEYEYSVYIFLIGNLGFLIQYQRIQIKIQKVEEILIKNSQTGLML